MPPRWTSSTIFDAFNAPCSRGTTDLCCDEPGRQQARASTCLCTGALKSGYYVTKTLRQPDRPDRRIDTAALSTPSTWALNTATSSRTRTATRNRAFLAAQLRDRDERRRQCSTPTRHCARPESDNRLPGHPTCNKPHTTNTDTPWRLRLHTIKFNGQCQLWAQGDATAPTSGSKSSPPASPAGTPFYSTTQRQPVHLPGRPGVPLPCPIGTIYAPYCSATASSSAIASKPPATPSLHRRRWHLEKSRTVEKLNDSSV